MVDISIETGSLSPKEVDRELHQILQDQQTNIKIVGCGGAGKNTLNRIYEIGIQGATTIGINTDAQDLLHTYSDKKLLIGKLTTKGLGAGSNPRLGMQAANENEFQIRELLRGSQMVFITAGLGGGTGSGSAPVVARIAKELGALVVVVITVPFKMEGQKRWENAQFALDQLDGVADTLVIIPNEKLLELHQDLPLTTAFKIADEILTNAVRGIAEMITKAGLVNLDLADVRAVMSNGGLALVGVGESDMPSRAREAVRKALINPLLDVDISGAKGAIINVCGGDDLTLNEAKDVVETVAELLDKEAKIIWGAQIYRDLAKTMRVMLIITGVAHPVFTDTHKNRKNYNHELGIEFVD